MVLEYLYHGFPIDLDNMVTQQPPEWFMARRMAPDDLNVSAEAEGVIRRYCYAVSVDETSIIRTVLHEAACESIGVSHDFAPFEDEGITKIPKPEEAVEIFWGALREYRSSQEGIEGGRR